MKNEYLEIEQITQLELSHNPQEQRAGALLAKHFEKLLKRQYSEFAQLCALRRDLNSLPPGPTRAKIAAEISDFVEIHSGKAGRLCKRIEREAGKA